MRKTIKDFEPELARDKASWLDVRTIAQVEVTSEDWRYPIESAFDERDERGWRAAERGKQTIRLFFDELRFIELEAQRNGQRTRPTHCGPCFTISGISVPAAPQGRSRITK